jgi:hypothetical protein
MTPIPVPIALIVDDPCPLVHLLYDQVAHERGAPVLTRDGRPMEPVIPNAFLDAFCDVVDAAGLRGKFSIVPAPAWKGDVVRGVNGDLPGTRAWLETARRRLGGLFDFCPECITHMRAVDLGTVRLLDQNESDWSQTQDRSVLTPYIAYALRLLRDAGIDATGVTSPWVFGERVEEEYIAAIMEAQRAVNGRTRSWYFLHMLEAHPTARPWVERSQGDTSLVSVPSNTHDAFWRSIDSPRTDRAFIDSMADELLGPDGKTGDIRTVLDMGGWPVILTHWQSLFSNGSWTGLAGLRELGARVRGLLSTECRWMSFSELAEETRASGATRPGYLPL